MQCFTHQDAPAVAVCKACGRAVCRACARDLGFAVACSERCQAEATESQEMTTRAKRIYGLAGAKKQLPLAPLMWGLLALPFLYLIVTTYLRSGAIEWFAAIFVVICIVIAIVSYRRTKALQLNC